MTSYRAPAVVAALLLLPTAVRPQAFDEGIWTGAISLVDRSPIPVAYTVSWRGDSLRITMQGLGTPRYRLTEIRIRSDALTFTWAPGRTGIPCELWRMRDQWYEGRCVFAGGGRVGLTMMLARPDAPPTGLARASIHDPRFTWVADTTEHIRVYAQPDSYVHRNMRDIARAVQTARDNGLQLLGEAVYPRPMDVFFVNSREEIAQLVGQTAGGWTDPLGSTVILVKNDSGPSAERHEIMHVLAVNLWGIPASPFEWINEGLAVFAAGELCGYENGHIAAYLSERELLIPFDALVHEFRRHDDLIAYLEAGSLVQFIHDTYGKESLRRVWSDGLAALSQLGDGDVDGFLERWRRHIANFPARTEVDWVLLREGC